MARLTDLTGKQFGRLTVVSQAPHDVKLRRVRWHCVCSCGCSTIVFGLSLRSGHTKSCGCLKRDNAPAYIHGRTGTTEHKIWLGMLARCENPNVKIFSLYGGQGISVCERWHSFEHFLADMGPRPSPDHSLDRIDPHRNYEPSNVRWASPLQQANNKRNTRWVTYRGKVLSLCDAVRAGGSVIHYQAAANRIAHGWTVEEAVETPSSRIRKAA